MLPDGFPFHQVTYNHIFFCYVYCVGMSLNLFSNTSRWYIYILHDQRHIDTARENAFLMKYTRIFTSSIYMQHAIN